VRLLSAIEVALDDPVRLVHALQGAADDQDAVRQVGAAFDADEQVARALMDLQFGRLTAASRARLADELRILRTDWGAPVDGELTLTGRRSGVLTVDGAARRFTARGLSGLLDGVAAFVRTDIAVPRLRPVAVVVTGAPGGPVGMTVWPDGTASFDYEDAGSAGIAPAGPG
jgi:hypothetical protein